LSTIAELRNDVDRLRGELEAAQHLLDCALVSATGIAIGDVVKGTDRHAGDEFKVTFVDVRFEGKPWLRGVKKRADGSWGIGVRHLYENWELVT
jgi:hypothetical protein